MDDPFTSLPRAAVLVYAGVLTAAAGSRALAEQGPAAPQTQANEAEPPLPQTAPTCGPACHDPNFVVEPIPYESDPVAPTCGPSCHDPYYDRREPNLDEPDPVAPTCGPSCHDPNDREYEPEPIPGKSRCTVDEDAGELDGGGLALIGLGLGLGLAARRRRAEKPEP